MEDSFFVLRGGSQRSKNVHAFIGYLHTRLRDMMSCLIEMFM